MESKNEFKKMILKIIYYFDYRMGIFTINIRNILLDDIKYYLFMKFHTKLLLWLNTIAY